MQQCKFFHFLNRPSRSKFTSDNDVENSSLAHKESQSQGIHEWGDGHIPKLPTKLESDSLPVISSAHIKNHCRFTLVIGGYPICSAACKI